MPPKVPQHDRSSGERLQKVLAAAGLGSRRQCEELILEGRVEVDRQVVTALGTRVDPARAEIRVDGEPLKQTRLAYYAVHKPTGVVSTARDPSGRPRVTDLVPPEAGRLFPVGRLDMSSEGLILLTNDGELANELMHPRYGVEKTYQVQVAGEPGPEVVTQLLRGVHLAEGVARAASARIKSHRKKSTVLEIVLSEGRNREIRRLLAKLGHKVQRLVRTAIGPLRLGDMPAGAYRRLTPEEIAKLQQAAAQSRRRDGEEEPAPSGRARHGKRPIKGKRAAPGKRPARGKGSTPSKRPPREAPSERPQPRVGTIIGGGGESGASESEMQQRPSRPAGGKKKPAGRFTKKTSAARPGKKKPTGRPGKKMAGGHSMKKTRKQQQPGRGKGRRP